MEACCSAIEIEFKKIQNDLQFSLHRLELEFHGRSDIPDVVTLVRRIQYLEDKMVVLQKKAFRVLESRQSLCDSLAKAVLRNNELLTRLAQIVEFSDESNKQVPDKPSDAHNDCTTCALETRQHLMHVVEQFSESACVH